MCMPFCHKWEVIESYGRYNQHNKLKGKIVELKCIKCGDCKGRTIFME